MSAEEKKRPFVWGARRRAFVAVGAVALFAAVYLGAAVALDMFGPDRKVSEDHVSFEPERDPFYVLLIGSDSRKGTALYTGKESQHAQVDQHSDVMTLTRVDPATHTVTLVTVPRDTVLEGESAKINETLVEGDSAKTVEAVERLAGVDVKYYMTTSFTEFDAMVDGLGGVVVDVPRAVTVPDPMTGSDLKLKAGENQLLDGAQALVLARARKEYGEDQDAHRQVNVRNIEIALMQRVMDMDFTDDDGQPLFSNELLLEVLADLEGNIDTNMNSALINYLVVDFVTHADEVTFYSCTGPYEGAENAEGLWVVPEDKETWAELMAVVDAGEDPSGIVAVPEMTL